MNYDYIPDIPDLSEIASRFADARISSYSASCPCCGADSLRIFKNFYVPGAVQIRCDTGCSRNAVLTRVGLRAADLYPQKVSSNVPFPNLSRENPIVKEYADDPFTESRWAVKFRGEIVCPHNLRRLANPEDASTLGTFKMARQALLLAGPAEIEALAVFQADAEMTLFPVQAPDVTAQAPDVTAQAPGPPPDDSVLCLEAGHRG